MDELHTSMYALLVISVDKVISEVEEMAARPEPCSREDLKKISGQLKEALLKAEDMYISEGE